MKSLIKGFGLILALAGLAYADGVQPIVPTSQVTYGSAQKNLTSNSDVTIGTSTHVLTATKGVRTSSVTFNDGTVLSSTSSITASAAWGSITGTLSNQTDLQTKFNNVGISTASLQTSINTLSASTTSIQGQVNGIVVSTTNIGASIATLSASTTSLQSQVNTNLTSITTLSASTTSLQSQITNLSPINLATNVTGILAPSHLVSTVAYTTSDQSFSGQNNWTTVLPSTFSGLVVMGSATINDATTGYVLTTDSNKHITSTNIFATNNNWTNFNSFTHPLGASVTYGLSAGSLTLTGLSPSGVVQTNGSSILTTGNVNLASQVTGNLPVTNLNSGTSATSATFWRGDGTWASQPLAASSLAVFNGVTQISSPTVSIGADGTSLIAYAIGGSSAGFKANPSSVTLQGNTFNGASQLVRLDSSSRLPSVNGVLLTSLNASNLTSGAVSDGLLSANVPLLGNTNIWTSQNTFGSVSVSSFTNGIYSPSVLFGDGTTQTTAFTGNLLTFSSGVVLNGTAVSVSSVSLSAQVVGNLGVSHLNSGTSASGTTFWRGDGTWATPSGGGGSSALAITTGSLSGFSSVASSPTAVVNFDSTTFKAVLAGGSTAFISLNGSSVTMQGNSFNTGSQLLQLSGGLVPDANIDSSSVTKQGNTFNGNSQLIQLDGSGHIPSLNGSAITSLNASNLTSGSIGSSEVNGVYGNVTGLGVQAQDLAMGGFKVTGSSTIASDASTTLATKGYVDASTTTALGSLNASNLTSGTIPNARQDGSSVTLQGNTFNTSSKLVQLDSSAKLPAVDGSQLINLPAPSGVILLQSTLQANATFFTSSGTVNTFNVPTSLNLFGALIKTTKSGITQRWINRDGGAANNFFGFGAGGNATSSAGTNNNAFGDNAGVSLNGGTDNNFFGSGAGQGDVGGLRNAGIGGNALTVNQSGNDNVGIGYSAGNNESGSQNTYIGSNAGTGTHQLTDAVAIGYNAQVISSYTMQLGGTGVDAVTVVGSTLSFSSGTITKVYTSTITFGDGTTQNTAASGSLNMSSMSIASQQSVGTTSFSSYTLIGVNITPRTSTSKIQITFTATNGGSVADCFFTFFRNSTNIGNSGSGIVESNTVNVESIAMNFVDAPGTTSSVNYSVAAKSSSSQCLLNTGGTLVAIQIGS